MKQDLFKRVVVPAMGVEGTTVLAISTPDDEFNYFSELFDLTRDDGTSLFHLIMVGLACKDCMDRGVGHECMHMMSDLPPWKSAERQKVMKAILARDPETFMRENQGMMVSKMQFIYQHLLQSFIRRAPYRFERNPSVMLSYIDTAGGGALSDHAATTFGFENLREVIVSADRTNSTRDEEILNMYLNHFRNLRKNKLYKDTMILVGFEANMGWDKGDRMNDLLSADEFQPIRLLQHIPRSGTGRNGGSSSSSSRQGQAKIKYGIWTDDVRKRKGVEELKAALIRGSLCYAVDFVTQARNPDDIRKIIHTQIQTYRREIEEPANILSGKFKESYSGKGAGGRRDDLVMCIQLLLVKWSELLQDLDFLREANDMGWIW